MFLAVLMAQVYDYRDLFARTYGGREDDWAHSVSYTSDGGFVLTGYTRSYGSGGVDVLVLKMDFRGDLEWARTYGGPGSEYGQSVIQTSDGGFVVIGHTRSFGSGAVDVLVIRLGFGGEMEWARAFGGTSSEYGRSVIETRDGGLVIVGNTRSFGAGASDALVLRLGPEGDLEWARTYGSTGSEYGHSVAEAGDGGFVVTGYTEEDAGARTDPLVMKLDPFGKMEWARKLDCGGSGYLYSVSPAPHGHIAAGWMRSPGASPDALVVKLSLTGGVEWARTFGGRGLDWAFSVKRTADGGYAVAGCISFGNYNFMVLKLLASGELDWVRTYGGPGWDAAFSLAQTQEGKLVIAGYTSSFGVGGDDILFLKLGADGGYSGCVVECPLIVSSPSLIASVVSLKQGVCSPTITVPALAVGKPSPMVSDVCPPVPEDWPGE